ncbi:MAG: hypothetical protein U0800_06860 [Isosphaeraceae bacterium]
MPVPVPKAATPAQVTKGAAQPISPAALPPIARGRLAWSACEGLSPRPTPSPDAEPTGSASFRIPRTVRRARREEAEGRRSRTMITWLQIARRNARPTTAVGWADSREILGSPSAEVDPRQHADAGRGDQHGHQLKKAGAEEFLEVPPAPAPRGLLGGPRQGFGPGLPVREANGFALIGPEPRFDPDSKAVPIAPRPSWVGSRVS